MRNDAKACGGPGPVVVMSVAYEKQLWCNRVAGHAGEHRTYDANTFRVIGAWKYPNEPIEQRSGRRKVRDA